MACKSVIFDIEDISYLSKAETLPIGKEVGKHFYFKVLIDSCFL